MGWANCGVNPDTDARMGYAHSGVCDQDGCGKKIHHGLAYVCGGIHQGGDDGCGEYFCYEHLYLLGSADQLCRKCADLFEREVSA